MWSSLLWIEQSFNFLELCLVRLNPPLQGGVNLQIASKCFQPPIHSHSLPTPDPRKSVPTTDTPQTLPASPSTIPLQLPPVGQFASYPLSTEIAANPRYSANSFT